MNDTNISIDAGISLLSRILGKTVTPTIWYGGVLSLEIGEIVDVQDLTPAGKLFKSPKGEYSISIDGNWVLTINGNHISGSELSSKDKKEITNLIGGSTISDIAINENAKVFTLILDENKLLDITSSNIDGGYFYFSSIDKNEVGLELTKNFDFKKIPRQ